MNVIPVISTESVWMHLGEDLRRYIRRRVSSDHVTDDLLQETFVRIHRGTLVRVDAIHEIVPEAHGDCDVVLRDGTTVKLSRRYRSRLLP